MAVKDSGLSNVIKNLNRELKKIKTGSLKGLVRASIFIRREMDDSAPSIPIDLGNLRASYYTVTSKGDIQAGAAPKFKGDEAAGMSGNHASTIAESKGKVALLDPALIMGFSAFYAVFVHENVDATFRQPKIGATKAPTGAKFFEAHLKQSRDKILAIVAQEARVK